MSDGEKEDPNKPKKKVMVLSNKDKEDAAKEKTQQDFLKYIKKVHEDQAKEMKKTLEKFVSFIKYILYKVNLKKKDQDKTEKIKKIIREEIVETILEEAPEDKGIDFNAFIFDTVIMAEEKDNKLIQRYK